MRPRDVPFDEVLHAVAQLSLSDFVPDLVVAVGRRGLVPGALVAARLGIPLVQIGARLYNDEMPARRLHAEPQIDIRQDDVAGKKILVADDVSNTGETLQAVKKRLLEAGANAVRTFVLLGKSDLSVSPFEKCVRFPWQ
jgi:uncharacterized protein